MLLSKNYSYWYKNKREAEAGIPDESNCVRVGEDCAESESVLRTGK
jgi:hypothetical protein